MPRRAPGESAVLPSWSVVWSSPSGSGSRSPARRRRLSDGRAPITTSRRRGARPRAPSTATPSRHCARPWRYPIAIDPPDSSGSLTATPVVADETVYVQDMRSNVYALRLDDGRLRWRHDIGFRNPGPNGLAIEGDRVYGVRRSVFALDAADGRPVWSRRILADVEYFVDIAPQVAGDRVFASTIGFAPRGRGALYALDRRTGRTIWRFDTIKDPWRYPLEAGGGGAWNTPSVDGDDVFWGISNPTPWADRASGRTAAPSPAGALHRFPRRDGPEDRDAAVARPGHPARHPRLRLPPAADPRRSRRGSHHLGSGKAGVVIAWNRTSGRRPLGAEGRSPPKRQRAASTRTSWTSFQVSTAASRRRWRSPRDASVPVVNL